MAALRKGIELARAAEGSAADTSEKRLKGLVEEDTQTGENIAQLGVLLARGGNVDTMTVGGGTLVGCSAFYSKFEFVRQRLDSGMRNVALCSV